MLLQQSFDFLVKTFKEGQTAQPAETLEAAYKRKRLDCCSDECRASQLCEAIWEDPAFRAIAENFMALKREQAPSVNLE